MDTTMEIRTIIPVRGRKPYIRERHITIGNYSIRTIIPVRGRKLFQVPDMGIKELEDKNHNPRKGMETFIDNRLAVFLSVSDKNHNPRKGTETIQQRNNSYTVCL